MNNSKKETFAARLLRTLFVATTRGILSIILSAYQQEIRNNRQRSWTPTNSQSSFSYKRQYDIKEEDNFGQEETNSESLVEIGFRRRKRSQASESEEEEIESQRSCRRANISILD